MKRVFVIILAIAAAAMGCRAQEVVEINSTRQAVKRTGDALLVAMPLATLTAVIVALAIAFPTIKNWVVFQQKKSARKKTYAAKGGRS